MTSEELEQDVGASRAATRFEWERAVLASDLPSTCRLVLLVLAVYMNADGTEARPGVPRLCAGTGLGDRAVRGHLSSAVETGWLQQVRRGHRLGNGTVRASEYRATVPPSTGTPVPDDTAGDRGLYRHVGAGGAPPQPASGAPQPASDDTSTGTRVPPTTQDHTAPPTTTAPDELPDELQVEWRRAVREWQQQTGQRAGKGMQERLAHDVLQAARLDSLIDGQASTAAARRPSDCTSCHGSGWGDELDPATSAPITCPACGGAGRVLMEAS